MFKMYTMFLLPLATIWFWWTDWLWLLVYSFILLLTLWNLVQWRCLQIKSPVSQTLKKRQTSTKFAVIMSRQSAYGKVLPGWHYAQRLRKPVISHSIDATLLDIMDLIYRDFILSWFQNISGGQSSLRATILSDMWLVVNKVRSRVIAVDVVKLVTLDMVEMMTDHFREAVSAQRRAGGEQCNGSQQFFDLQPWLQSKEAETDLMRGVTEALLLILFPDPYSKCDLHRHLLREIIATSVMRSTVDMLCNPDFINRKILANVQQQERASEGAKRTFMYAASYEEFIKLIHSSKDYEELSQMRYKIICEIVHAATVSNLKTAPCIDSEVGDIVTDTAKGELLKTRNLKRYINQLSVAKQQTEKRMHVLVRDSKERPLTLTDPGLHDMLAKEGYYDSEAVVGDTLDMPDGCSVRSKDLFSELVDDESHGLSSTLDTDLDDFEDIPSNQLSPGGRADLGGGDDVCYMTHQSYVQQLLRQLHDKISGQLQVLRAMRSSSPSNTEDVTGIQRRTEQDVRELRAKKLDLEGHIRRSALWARNLGHWAVTVTGAFADVGDGDHSVTRFVLSVSSDGDLAPDRRDGRCPVGCQTAVTTTDSCDIFVELSTGGRRSSGLPAGLASSSDWKVERSLEDCHRLHERLSQIKPSIGIYDLPRENSGLFCSADLFFLSKAKEKLQAYLNVVMSDDHLSQYECLYIFLTPTPSFLLHQPAVQLHDNLSTVSFKGCVLSFKPETLDNEEDFLCPTEEGGKYGRSQDSIAKPLYRFIGEVFELQGLFKWVRRSFITLVELTLGYNINRQLRRMVRWFYSEPMLLLYLNTFKASMWPGGKLADSSSARTEAEKFETRMQAKAKLLANIPDMLKNLVGEDNARRGVVRWFELLQSEVLNKHLFYNMLEVVLLSLCPELRREA